MTRQVAAASLWLLLLAGLAGCVEDGPAKATPSGPAPALRFDVANVTVAPGQAATFRLAPTGNATAPPLGEVEYTSVGRDRFAFRHDGNGTITLLGIRPGRALFGAAWPGGHASVQVEVAGPALTGLSVTPSRATVHAGDTLAFSAHAATEAGVAVDVTGWATFTLDGRAVNATVPAQEAGALRLVARFAGWQAAAELVVCTQARHRADQPPDSALPSIQVVYVSRNSTAKVLDRGLDWQGNVSASLAAANDWFAAQSGGARFRFDTCGGRIDVRHMELTTGTVAEPLAGSEDLERDGAPVLVLAEVPPLGEGRCGEAHVTTLDGVITKSTAYVSLDVAGTPCGFGPLLAGPGEPAGGREFTILHELIHALGFVPECAPHWDSAGGNHVADPGDLMNATAAAGEALLLDRGRDDYFGHSIPGCPDLQDSALLEWPEGTQPGPQPG